MVLGGENRSKTQFAVAVGGGWTGWTGAGAGRLLSFSLLRSNVPLINV